MIINNNELKKKSILLSIFLIISIQTILLISNSTKTSFRIFIWNIEEVGIGRLISISFFSGLLISSILNKTLYNDVINISNNEEEKKLNNANENSVKSGENNASFEMPPERDLRDIQPTISVNYRVIKDNGVNELKERNQRSEDIKYQDDWYNNDSEW
tara:strand:- start:537 stop:1010 length:474 start_codon:yes stop_codon:yes gene_type:complete